MLNYSMEANLEGLYESGLFYSVYTGRTFMKQSKSNYIICSEVK